MKQFTRRVRRYGRTLLNSRIITAFVGLILSVVLHELFHVIVHWGNIIELRLLPDHTAIVAITSKTPAGYNSQIEELIAYAISLVTMLVTVIIISKQYDKQDTRTAAQTLFPHHSKMQQMSQQEFYELAARINLV